MTNNFFINNSGDIRKIFKLIIFILLFQLIGVILLKTIIPIFNNNEFYLSFVVNSLSCTAVIVALLVYVKYIDKNPLKTYGLYFNSAFAKNFFWGAVVGSGIIILALLQYGFIRLEFNPSSIFTEHSYATVILVQFIRYLAGSLFEEILATAFLYVLIVHNNKSKRIHYTAVIISALVFGTIHSVNENATILGVINLVLFGAYTTLKFSKNRNLAFVVGFHCFWNFTQNIVFGLPNSGKEPQAWVFKLDLLSNDLFSGGKFGLEGSIIITLIFLTLIFMHLKNEKYVE